MATERSLERRIVSVLFADLVGFTSLSEQLDAEDVVTVQTAYFDTVREVIERYGGRLEKFIGDAAMAVFGIPRASDDDAERAVRAGLALGTAVDQLGARVGLGSRELAVRVGVNTGEVVHAPDAGPEEAMVTGDPVNVAARLQAAAAPGEVLVGELTALSTEAVIELGDVRPLELKGKAAPVLARSALAARARHSRELAMGALRAPLLGRDEELRLLRSELAGAAESPRMLIVAAPPGVGKTRLVEEFAEAADAGVLHARLRPDVLAPFDSVAQLFLSAVPSDLSGIEKRLRAAGATGTRARALADEARTLVRPGSDGVVAADRDARFAAWLEALDLLAGGGTALWIVEDLHWAGPDLLAFLAHAAGAPGRRLVLATARPSLLGTGDGRPRPAAILDLLPLAPAAASELVRRLVGDALPEGLVARIAERSDGNPLFVEELLRTWISVGALVGRDGGWVLVRSEDEVPLPATVRSIYAAQLDDLPEPARSVARRASVAGRRFPLAALDALEVRDGRDGVETLSRRALVSGPTYDTLVGSSYVYRHALLRDAGYASLAKAERAKLHVRLAGWLADAAGPRAGQLAETIGRHYARALESTPALARHVDARLGREDCRRLAASWLERAAEAALAQSAHEGAEALLRRALELTAEDEEADRSRRLAALGETIATSADMDEGARLLDEALRLARRVGERALIARAAAGVSRLLDQQVQFGPAATAAARALEEIGEQEDVATALLLVRRATAISNGDDLAEQPLADAERALGIARAVRHERVELEALHLLASLRGADLDTWHELERLSLERGAWDMAAEAMFTRALRLVPDRAREARPVLDGALELSEARGLREALTWSHYCGVELGLVAGEWDEAVAAARRALDLGIPNGYDRAVVRTWSALLPLAAARGDERLLAEGAAWLSGRFREPEAPSLYALVMMAARRLELARESFGTGFVPGAGERVASFGLVYGSPSWLAALDTVFVAWLAADALDAAAQALARLESATDRAGAAELARATHALLAARLAAARGEDPAAWAERAVTHARGSAAPWWEAKALRLVGSPEGHEEADRIERALGIPSSPDA